MKKLWPLLCAAGLVVIDQLIKIWAVATLKDGTVIPWIEGVFELRYCENTGVAFSMLENQRWLFVPLSALVSLLMVFVLLRSPLCQKPLFLISATLILAGGVGNLIDRAVLGYVVDLFYFKLIDFPIFNFADCCVVVGAVLLFVFVLFGSKDIGDMPLRTALFGISMKKESADEGE